jgi:membrane fusion protein (multidrug efflux system)
MRKYSWIFYLLALIIVLTLVKIWYFKPVTPQGGKPGGGPGGGPSKPMTVDGYIVSPKKLDNQIYLSGNILPNEMVELRTEVPGKITAIYFSEGQMITAGKLMVKLFDADLQANLRKIQSQINLAGQKEKRLAELLKVQGISREEYDIVMNELQQLQAEKEIVEVQISRTEIKAPFTGKTGFRSVSKGSYITPADIITTIEQLNPVKIECSLPEKYSSEIKEGKILNFTVAGNPRQHTAKVYARNPSIDINTRNLKIRALADNSRQELSPGGFANVQFPLNIIGEAMMIPTYAVVPILKGQQVFVVRDGKAMPVKVNTGVRTDQYVQITEGLVSGDTIILTGLMALKPEMPVNIAQIKE